MSYCECDGEMPSLFFESRHTARKEHKCYECRRTIRPGEQYESVRGVWEGRFEFFKTCQHCLALRDWVKAHVPCFCWMYGDVRNDAIETALSYAHEAPGLLFGAYRREIAIRRARKAGAQA